MAIYICVMRKLKNEELKRLTKEEFKSSAKLPLIVILDDVRSMHNVGSVFRTCDAFRIEALYLCGITGKPPAREIAKTALGATETVTWKYFNNVNDALSELKKKGYQIFATEQAEGSQSPEQCFTEAGRSYAVVFGNEVKGVKQEVIDSCDGVIEIDQSGTKHSLNIAVCAGIVCWEFFRMRREKH